MIEERRYCPEILTQIGAVNSALKSLASTILGSHLQHCVKDAMESKNQSETDKKIDEIIDLFKKG